MRSLRTAVIIILIIGTLLCIVPIVFFLVTFGSTDISSYPQNWGVFGDYFGGTLNPILSTINLALLIAISVYLARMDTNRQTNEFRYKAYTELCAKLDSTTDSSESLQRLLDYLTPFRTNHQFLFTGVANLAFNNVVEELSNALISLIPHKEEFEEGVATGKIQVIELSQSDQRRLGKALSNFPPVITPETKANNEYEAAKLRVVAFMQVAMIDADIRQFLPH